MVNREISKNYSNYLFNRATASASNVLLSAGAIIFVLYSKDFFLIGIHSMQGWAATTKHEVTRKRNTKRLRHTGNLFRKNIQLKDVC